MDDKAHSLFPSRSADGAGVIVQTPPTGNSTSHLPPPPPSVPPSQPSTSVPITTLQSNRHRSFWTRLHHRFVSVFKPGKNSSTTSSITDHKDKTEPPIPSATTTNPPPLPSPQVLDDLHTTTKAIMPFLATADRKVLSVASEGYDHYQHRIDHALTTTKRAINTMARQALVSSLLPSFMSYLATALTNDGAQHINKTTLDLTLITAIDDKDVQSIIKAMRKGCWRELESLRLPSPSGHSLLHLSPDGFQGIMNALAHGACPSIKHLSLGSIHKGAGGRAAHPHYEGGVASAVVRALESGACRHLMTLEVGILLGRNEWRRLSEALVKGSCRGLRSLDLSGCFIRCIEGASSISEAFKAGCCPALEVLKLDDHPGMGPYLVVPVAHAIQTKRLPELHTLSLHHMRMSRTTSEAFGAALSCPHHKLTNLGLNGAFWDEGCAASLTTAILNRGVESLLQGYPRLELQEIHLRHNNLTFYRCYSLSMIMHCGHFSELTTLDLGDNPFMGDEGMTRICTALESKSCPNLSTLVIDASNLQTLGGQTFASFLRSRVCPKLETLGIQSSPSADVKSLVYVMEAIGDGACPQLQSLLLSGSKVDGEVGWALAKAIKGGALSKLQELRLESDKHMDTYGIVAIMDALYQGRCPGLQHLSTPVGHGFTAIHILARAIAREKMPSLKALHLNCEGVPRSTARRCRSAIDKAMSLRACPRLKSFTIHGSPQVSTKQPSWWKRMMMRR